jgi:hypothetical protein
MDQPLSQTYLIPFCDDSTLIFATAMRRLLIEAGVKVDLALYEPEAVLSARQITAYLPQGDFGMLTADGLKSAAASGQYEALVTSRVFEPLKTLLELPAFKAMGRRAQIIGFLGGLDFFPERGLRNRKHCDAVYLFPKDTADRFEVDMLARKDGTAPPLVGFGHPVFLMPPPQSFEVGEAAGATGDIYFFTQAISPSTKRARLHILDMLIAIARANPKRNVWIKLRHLPSENTDHLHQERFSYPELLDMQGRKRPENLKLTACTMAEAVRTTGVGITCTSTAAVDLLREGVPTMVYLDYVDNYVDPLAPPMRSLFHKSGLIKSLEDILRLRHSAPNPEWIANMFCHRDLAKDVVKTVARLRAAQSAA